MPPNQPLQRTRRKRCAAEGDVMRQRTKCEISDHLPFISSNTRILPMKQLVTIVLILLSGCTTAPDVTENAIPSRSASVAGVRFDVHRADEHTSELQSPMYLVCRLLLEKKKIKYT